jgi:hypothetical protein
LIESEERRDPKPLVPGWVRILDAAALTVAAVLLWKIFSADTRAGIFGLIPRVHTPTLIYALAALLAVRHIVLLRPTAMARLAEAWRRLTDRPHWGPAIRAFVATRLLVFLVALFSVASYDMPKAGIVLAADPLMNLPMRFDAGWYGGIALEGYDRNVNFERQRNIAFFPAMPMLMRALGPAFGSTTTGVPVQRRVLRILWAGVFISLIAFLLALAYVDRLAGRWLGRDQAANAVLLLASYPFACFYNAPYTESLFLLGTVGAAYHFYQRQWWQAAAWGFLVGLTRPNGFFLSVPLGLLALQPVLRSYRGSEPFAPWTTFKALAAAAMPVAGMLAFTAYLYSMTGVWFAWARSHGAWGRTYTGFEPLNRGFKWVMDDGLIRVLLESPFSVLNTSAAAFALVMLWVVARRIGAAWAIYIVVILGPPIFAGGALSLGRVTSTLFPIFLALAAVVPSRAAPSLAVAFAVGQGLCTALFFTWRELF